MEMLSMTLWVKPIQKSIVKFFKKIFLAFDITSAISDKIIWNIKTKENY